MIETAKNLSDVENLSLNKNPPASQILKEALPTPQAFIEKLPTPQAFIENLPTPQAFIENQPTPASFKENLPTSQALVSKYPEYMSETTVESIPHPHPFIGRFPSHYDQAFQSSILIELMSSFIAGHSSYGIFLL